MKLVYPICCGVDVHKNLLVATGVKTDSNNISTYIQESFSTLNPDLIRFKGWLIRHDCKHVCMESTGKYWIPVFNYLENDIYVCLTHPKYVKAIKGKKETYFSTKYYNIKKRRGHNKAIIAIARMMLVCIFHMVSNGEFFNPCDYEELKNPKPKLSKSEGQITLDSALNYIAAQGIDISVLTLPS